MALRLAAQQALRQAARSLAAESSTSVTVVRGMALEGAKGFSEKETAVENLYFTKEDQRLMGKLLAKIKEQSDVVDKHAAEGVAAAEKSALKHIIAKYNVSDADVEKLMKWKHTHF